MSRGALAESRIVFGRTCEINLSAVLTSAAGMSSDMDSSLVSDAKKAQPIPVVLICSAMTT